MVVTQIALTGHVRQFEPLKLRYLGWVPTSETFGPLGSWIGEQGRFKTRALGPAEASGPELCGDFPYEIYKPLYTSLNAKTAP